MITDMNIGTKMPEKIMVSIETEWISFLPLLKSFCHFVQRRQMEMVVHFQGRNLGPQTNFWEKTNLPSGAGHTEVLDFQGKSCIWTNICET